MEKKVKINSENIHKPLTMEQMTQLFSQEDKNAITSINREVLKSKYDNLISKPNVREIRSKLISVQEAKDEEKELLEISEGYKDFNPFEEDFGTNEQEKCQDMAQKSNNSNELNELYRQYEKNDLELKRLHAEQECIIHRIEEINKL